MQRPSPARSHRFVVVYREDAREIAGAQGVWRGWVEKVPDPRTLDSSGTTAQRYGFLALTELPDLMVKLIAAAATNPVSVSDQRPKA